ncbi:MAG: TonB-dependent receptor, partial [Bacteroidales bacterium]
LFSGVFLFLFFIPFTSLLSQTEKNSANKLDSVVVEAYRAGKNTPVTHSAINLKELRESSPVHSIPMILSMMPSVVSSTEGGNGLGYSSLRIRGSEATRINVTLNGVALNDGESQQVFWVNIPAFQSFLQDIQVVRGVGTSVNGAGAFGASINMRTIFTPLESYGMAEFGVGSYNTMLSTVGAGTGRLTNGLSVDVRFSHNSGDGYIRNAKTDLKSLYASVGWYKGNNALRLNYIMGDQYSGITWEGISREQATKDRRFNPAGTWHDAAGNIHYYDNEIDNFTQHHIQGHYTHSFSPSLLLSSTLHFTKGDGYYENYKANKKFSSYGLPNQIIEEITYKKSDVIIRQGIDNHYVAFNANLAYNGGIVKSTTGVSYSYHHGEHKGKFLWSMYNNNIPANYQWYDNYGYKSDFSFFTKAEVNILEKIVLFADLQYRRVDYTLRGDDKDFVSLNWNDSYNFFNPKGGATFNLNNNNQFYTSVAVGRKEPGRSDIKESIKAGSANEILPERVIDYEIGYRYSSKKLAMAANIYLMEYKDQLVPTGKISETGYVIKENVKNSYRRGVELTAAWKPISLIALNGNLTLSTNKIKDYTQYLDLFELDWSPSGQKKLYFKETEIAFSPSITAMVALSFYPTKTSSLSLIGKYVGDQYLDNTLDKSNSVPSYFVTSLTASKSFEIKSNRFIDIHFFIDNLFDNMYFSNGWVYKAQFTDGSKYLEEGVYPQAGINFTAKVSLRF